MSCIKSPLVGELITKLFALFLFQSYILYYFVSPNKTKN